MTFSYQPEVKIFPHSTIAQPRAALENIDDSYVCMDHLGWPPAGWTLFTGGGGSIATSAAHAKFGPRSLRLNCPNLASWAYVKRGITIQGTGLQGLLAYVYIVNYYGNTVNDYQYIGAYSAALRYEIGWWCYATQLQLVVGGAGILPAFAPLSTDTWHKLFASLDYTTREYKGYVNDVLMVQGTSGVVPGAPDALYLGDGSAATSRGDFYWDSTMYGRIVA